MRVKRFYFVAGPRSSKAHMAEHRTEGYRTFCGIEINLRWRWLKKRRHDKKAVVCSRCRQSKS